MSQLVRLRGTQTAQTAHCALEERGCQLMAELLMPAAVTSLISGFSSRLWGYSLISGQSSRIWGILAFSKHTGNWRFYTLLVMFRRCVDPGYLNVRDSFSKSRQERPDPKNGAENRWSPGCGGCGCQGFVSKLGFGEKGLRIMPPQFQWTGIGGMALYSHSRGGQRIKGDLAFIAVEW